MAALVACGVSSTAVRDPTHENRTYPRVLVYARCHCSKYPNLRRNVENTIVTKLKTARVDATAAVDLGIEVPDASQRIANHNDLEPHKARLLEAGFNCVLQADFGDGAIVYTSLGGTLLDMIELGKFGWVPIPGAKTSVQWDEQHVWRDGVELRSVAWSYEAIIVRGADRLADDLLASGLLATTVVPDAGAPGLNTGLGRSAE
jgi:hypothetical protein